MTDNSKEIEDAKAKEFFDKFTLLYDLKYFVRDVRKAFSQLRTTRKIRKRVKQLHKNQVKYY